LKNQQTISKQCIKEYIIKFAGDGLTLLLLAQARTTRWKGSGIAKATIAEFPFSCDFFFMYPTLS